MDLDPGLVIDQGAGVYRPSEDTRLLAEAVVRAPGESFLEVGTGTGFVALHAARRGPVVATDVNRAAVELTRANAQRNGLPVDVVRTHLAAGVRGSFQVIAFNPPYLEGEPDGPLDRAWAGGRGGSAVALEFLSDLPRILASGGRAYLLLSTANTAARKEAGRRFRVRRVARQRLFFEELEVLELRHRGPSRASRTSRSSARSRGP